jgi:hypothetical protein
MPLSAQYRTARKGSASCVNGDTGWRNRMKNGLFRKFNYLGSRLFQKIHGFREMHLHSSGFEQPQGCAVNALCLLSG